MNRPIVSMTLADLLDVLRQETRQTPGGTVLISIKNNCNFMEFPASFVRLCINEIEHLSNTSSIESPSNLERLAIQLLLSNAEITI